MILTWVGNIRVGNVLGGDCPGGQCPRTTIEQYPWIVLMNPDSKVHEANMGATWVLSAPGGPHVGPINLVVRGGLEAVQLSSAA